MLEFFKTHPTLLGSYYYKAVFEENCLIEDFCDNKKVTSLLLEGVEQEKCPACAAKLLYFHIEPCKINNGMPDYDCEKGLSYVIDVIKTRGLFEYIDHKEKKMKLLHMVFNYLDMSSNLREYIIKV